MINNKVYEAIEDLHGVLKSELSEHVVSVNIFINASEFEIKFNARTPEQLKMSGVSMRNLSGDFIK